MSGSSLILLHPTDNVLVCVAAVAAGEAMTIDGEVLAAPEAVAVGHKVARHALAASDKVMKYGAPIGLMTRPVERGGWIQVHNMKSDYIATHTRQTIHEEGH
jgi:D-threo-aldose 1-dehydrogenase